MGWLLVSVALLMASADAVLALGPGDHPGIATGDIWMLLAGKSPQSVVTPASLGAMLMALPAWTVIGPLGIVLVAAFRPRRRRYRHMRFD